MTKNLVTTSCVAIMLIVSMIACGGSAPPVKSASPITGDPNRALVQEKDGFRCERKGATEQDSADYLACLEGLQKHFGKAPLPPAGVGDSTESSKDESSLGLPPFAQPVPGGGTSFSPVAPPVGVGPFYGLPVGAMRTYGPTPSGACIAPATEALYVFNELPHSWVIPKGQVVPMGCDLGIHFVPALIIPKGTTTPRWEWAIPSGATNTTPAVMHLTGAGNVAVTFEVYEMARLPNGQPVPGRFQSDVLQRPYWVPRFGPVHNQLVTSSLVDPS